MPFLDTIVAFINRSLQDGMLNAARFQPAKFHGLSTQLVRRRTESSPLELLPAVMTTEGEYTYVEPNDSKRLVVYHKALSNVYSKEKRSYGDDHDYKCTSELQLIVWADGAALDVTAEALEPLFIYGLPARLDADSQATTGFRSCTITPLSSNMDRIQNFRTEYPQTPFFLKPAHHFFSVRYRVEAVFDRTCVAAIGLQP